MDFIRHPKEYWYVLVLIIIGLTETVLHWRIHYYVYDATLNHQTLYSAGLTLVLGFCISVLFAINHAAKTFTSTWSLRARLGTVLTVCNLVFITLITASIITNMKQNLAFEIAFEIVSVATCILVGADVTWILFSSFISGCKKIINKWVTPYIGTRKFWVIIVLMLILISPGTWYRSYSWTILPHDLGYTKEKYGTSSPTLLDVIRGHGPNNQQQNATPPESPAPEAKKNLVEIPSKTTFDTTTKPAPVEKPKYKPKELKVE